MLWHKPPYKSFHQFCHVHGWKKKSCHFHFVPPKPWNNGFKKNRKPGTFKNRIKFRNPSWENLDLLIFLVPEPNFGTLPSGKCHDQQATTQLPTHKRRWIKEFANALHAVIVKEVADALTLQCYCCQEFEKFSNAPPCHCQKCCTSKLKVIADAPI